MDHEFTFSEYETDGFHLRADGLFKLAGMVIPLSAALHDSKSGRSVVNKEPGEGGLLTITSAEGKMEAKFKRGQWHVRTDIPTLVEEFTKVGVSGDSFLPKTPAGRNAEVQYPMPDSVKRPSLYGMIATIAVIAIVLALGYYTFEEPIGRVMQAHGVRQEIRAKETEIRLLEAKAKEEYRVLEKKVRTNRATAVDTIAAVEQASSLLAAELLESTKVSLPDLTKNPNETPREIDQLTRKDASFLSAWNHLLNAYVSERRLEVDRERLRAIDVHDNAGKLRSADLIEAERIGGTLRKSLKSFEGVDKSLAIVQEKLASKRLQEKLSQEIRSSP